MSPDVEQRAARVALENGRLRRELEHVQRSVTVLLICVFVLIVAVAVAIAVLSA